MTEVWPDHGHYPHLVDPDRFVARLREFWTLTAWGSCANQAHEPQAIGHWLGSNQ